LLFVTPECPKGKVESPPPPPPPPPPRLVECTLLYGRLSSMISPSSIKLAGKKKMNDNLRLALASSGRCFSFVCSTSALYGLVCAQTRARHARHRQLHYNIQVRFPLKQKVKNMILNQFVKTFISCACRWTGKAGCCATHHQSRAVGDMHSKCWSDALMTPRTALFGFPYGKF